MPRTGALGGMGAEGWRPLLLDAVPEQSQVFWRPLHAWEEYPQRRRNVTSTTDFVCLINLPELVRAERKLTLFVRAVSKLGSSERKSCKKKLYSLP